MRTYKFRRLWNGKYKETLKSCTWERENYYFQCIERTQSTHTHSKKFNRKNVCGYTKLKFTRMHGKPLNPLAALEIYSFFRSLGACVCVRCSTVCRCWQSTHYITYTPINVYVFSWCKIFARLNITSHLIHSKNSSARVRTCMCACVCTLNSIIIILVKIWRIIYLIKKKQKYGLPQPQ